MSSGDASRIVQCNLGIFDSFRLLPIKNGCIFPRTLCNVMCFQFDIAMMQFFAVGDGRVPYWTSFAEVNRFRRERDIHSLVKKLSFLKMTPCLNTGEQLEQISVKLLIYLMY